MNQLMEKEKQKMKYEGIDLFDIDGKKKCRQLLRAELREMDKVNKLAKQYEKILDQNDNKKKKR